MVFKMGEIRARDPSEALLTGPSSDSLVVRGASRPIRFVANNRGPATDSVDSRPVPLNLLDDGHDTIFGLHPKLGEHHGVGGDRPTHDPDRHTSESLVSWRGNGEWPMPCGPPPDSRCRRQWDGDATGSPLRLAQGPIPKDLPWWPIRGFARNLRPIPRPLVTPLRSPFGNSVGNRRTPECACAIQKGWLQGQPSRAWRGDETTPGRDRPGVP